MALVKSKQCLFFLYCSGINERGEVRKGKYKAYYDTFFFCLIPNEYCCPKKIREAFWLLVFVCFFFVQRKVQYDPLFFFLSKFLTYLQIDTVLPRKIREKKWLTDKYAWPRRKKKKNLGKLELTIGNVTWIFFVFFFSSSSVGNTFYCMIFFFTVLRSEKNNTQRNRHQHVFLRGELVD